MDQQNPPIERAKPNPSDNTVALVNLVAEIGPDIAEISRRLGQFKESVRYRFNQKILNKGFPIQAIPNYGALGLKRVVMSVRMGNAYSEIAQQVFSAMSEMCYIVAYAGVMPDGTYLLHAGLPVEFGDEFRSMMDELKKMGVFSSIDFFDCDAFRVAPMRAESFDFEHGVWEFDWTKPLPLDATTVNANVSQRTEFDKIDLLIVKELSKDSRKSLSEIQESIRKTNGLEVNYKTLVWHHSHHVLPRRLISGHSIAWHGVKYDFKTERKNLRPHGYLFVAIVVRGVSPQERMALMGTVNRLPFLWSEAVGTDYFAQFAFPVENSNEALEFLKRLIGPFGSRASYFPLNQKEMLSFTIGHNLWDEGIGAWSLDSQSILVRFQALILKLRELGMSRA